MCSSCTALWTGDIFAVAGCLMDPKAWNEPKMAGSFCVGHLEVARESVPTASTHSQETHSYCRLHSTMTLPATLYERPSRGLARYPSLGIGGVWRGPHKVASAAEALPRHLGILVNSQHLRITRIIDKAHRTDMFQLPVFSLQICGRYQRNRKPHSG